MPQAISTLLALIMALVFGINTPADPETTPPFSISEEAKNMNMGESGKEGQGEAQQNQSQNQAENGDLNQNHYADDKVPAYNNKSEKVMPTLIPQVAVDKSPALEEYSEENGQEPDPLNDNQPQGVVQTHAQFGLSVANNQPDEAKENKAAFGEETSQNAQENKRPE
jgi:hypothetical protein